MAGVICWDGQERRKTAREGVVDANTQELLIRIDERTKRMDAAMFGEHGMDKRRRQVEQDNAATKARSGIIAFAVSTVVAIIGIVLGKK